MFQLEKNTKYTEALLKLLFLVLKSALKGNAQTT